MWPCRFIYRIWVRGVIFDRVIFGVPVAQIRKCRSWSRVGGTGHTQARGGGDNVSSNAPRVSEGEMPLCPELVAVVAYSGLAQA
jgi:hypothetical protein